MWKGPMTTLVTARTTTADRPSPSRGHSSGKIELQHITTNWLFIAREKIYNPYLSLVEICASDVVVVVAVVILQRDDGRLLSKPSFSKFFPSSSSIYNFSIHRNQSSFLVKIKIPFSHTHSSWVIFPTFLILQIKYEVDNNLMKC